MEGLALATTDISRADADVAATTSARLKANRSNAARSTGPRTGAGKQRSSKNAMKHGLLSRDVMLGDEDANEFDVFEREMRKALRPRGGLERSLAARAIAAAWRLRRFERIEALMLEAGRYNWLEQEVGLSAGFIDVCANGDAFSRLSRYEAGIERAFFRALHELQRAQASRAGQAVSLPAVVDVNVSAPSRTADAP